ncbi:MAG: Nif3-like dinuclear metal center hexameric protein [Ginsengibacter sp.]
MFEVSTDIIRDMRIKLHLCNPRQLVLDFGAIYSFLKLPVAMLIKEVIQLLEQLAPLSFQEHYDNSGLLTGTAEMECSGILISLDCIESVVEEAIKRKCNLIISHHPIIFSGLKKITGKNYVERTIIKAIKYDIAIYAIHTNLDNVINGVNGKIASLLGLKNIKVLRPSEGKLKKLVTFSPIDSADKVRNALFEEGGGAIGKYNECSFNIEGTGTFKPLEGANPHTGEINKRYEGKELKIEIIFPEYLEKQLIAAMKAAHPYEEVAYDILSVGNYLSDVGSGVIGELEAAIDSLSMLNELKVVFSLKVVKHTKLLEKPIKTIAVCGGAGIFLLKDALINQADMYITSDIKYHEFFDAEDRLVLADIGHYESEQFTRELLYEFLKEKCRNFAVLKSEVNTNPVNYFI